MTRVDTVILGAGLTGLATAFRLRSDYILLEKDDRPGGLARTEKIAEYLFDCTGHWLHLRDPRTRQLVNDLLGGHLTEVTRVSKIYYRGSYIDYPFQANISGLPDEIKLECVWGAIKAHLERDPESHPGNFEEFSRTLFGDGITDHFMVPYNRKLWGCEPSEISPEWCGRFFPKPDLEQIVRGALGLNKEATGYNAHFVYPKEGGIEALARALSADLDALQTNSAPDAIHFGERWLEVGGERIHYRRMVSSVPLPELLKIGLDLPGPIRKAVGSLRCTKLRYVNYGVKGKPLDGIQWLYISDPRLPFYRVGCSSNAVPTLAPPECSSLYVEIGNDHNLSDSEVLSAIRTFFVDLGIVHSQDDIHVEALRRLPYGYVIFDGHYDKARPLILSYLASQQVDSIGRFGAWIYSSMEDALLSGLTTADAILKKRRGKDPAK